MLRKGDFMENTIDLHTHTTKSDGTFLPDDLLKLAENQKLSILSITDHESVDAYYDMDRSLFSGKIIPGIELRTSCFGVAIELLGYGFDIDKMNELHQEWNLFFDCIDEDSEIYFAKVEEGVMILPEAVRDAINKNMRYVCILKDDTARKITLQLIHMIAHITCRHRRHT